MTSPPSRSTSAPQPAGEKLLPLLRLALKVGDSIPERVREEAARIFERQIQREAGATVALGPLYAHLVVHEVQPDQATALCLYLARTQDLLDVQVDLPAAVAERPAGDKNRLLASFMHEVAVMRDGIPNLPAGGTRVLDQEREPTVELKLGQLSVPPPATQAGLLEVVGRQRGRLHPLLVRGRSPEQALPFVIGRSPDADLIVDDEQASWEHAHIEGRRGQYTLRDLDSQNGVFVNGLGIEEHELAEGDRIQIGSATTLKFVLLDELEAELLDDLHDANRMDPLTGVLDRRALFGRLSSECSHFRRHGRNLSVLLVDLDRLGEINGERSVEAGDQALVHVANKLRDGLREEDELGRTAGQQFVCVLRDTDGDWAIQVAERLRQSIFQARVPNVQPPLTVTVSIGVAAASAKRAEHPRALLNNAVAHVHKAKAEGRNQVFPPVSDRASETDSGPPPPSMEDFPPSDDG